MDDEYLIEAIIKKYNIDTEMYEYTDNYEIIPKGSTILYIDKQKLTLKSGYLIHNDENSIFKLHSSRHRKSWYIYPIHHYIFYRSPQKNSLGYLMRNYLNNNFTNIVKLDHPKNK